jgi:hypothetical protein
MAIRFSPIEYQQLQQEARRAGQTPTEYLRNCWQKVRQ